MHMYEEVQLLKCVVGGLGSNVRISSFSVKPKYNNNAACGYCVCIVKPYYHVLKPEAFSVG